MWTHPSRQHEAMYDGDDTRCTKCRAKLYLGDKDNICQECRESILEDMAAGEKEDREIKKRLPAGAFIEKEIMRSHGAS